MVRERTWYAHHHHHKPVAWGGAPSGERGEVDGGFSRMGPSGVTAYLPPTGHVRGLWTVGMAREKENGMLFLMIL
jgi:hypothetical protein